MIENRLHTFFSDACSFSKVLKAMRYSLLAGGKRIRPVLTLEFCKLSGGIAAQALDAACAVEMVHTYSLIHDDLPCMDNDRYRRGNLTNHIVYGEATALLAGDALLTYAFELLSRSGIRDMEAAIRSLSSAAGAYGMIGGQQLDLEYEGQNAQADVISETHRLKTGCLLKTACELGVIAAGGSDSVLSAARIYAEKIGLAFQMRDDILDVIGDAGKLGKMTGTDGNKNTFVKLYGISQCEKIISEETEEACEAISYYPNSDFLIWLAEKLAFREL